MSHPLPKHKKYTYADYLTWPLEERWELIDGVPHNMSPAPSRRHQEILVEMLRQFSNYLLDKSCRVYSAPFDVRLPQSNETDETATNVVQPDIVVVCDKSKLDDKGCTGAPDLIVEIICPGSAFKDLRDKFRLYESSGVKEYWIVHPNDNTVLVFKLGSDGHYGKPGMYSEQDEIEVGVLEDLTISLKTVFEE
ncbi:hypothetical protein SCACP_39100 [Sporomusa carbonis]|uniref:Uma2 family endonuclease n=1 Tax=Sporomusa carbonis TaxID=3076075 RepID=UPI003A6BD4BD